VYWDIRDHDEKVPMTKYITVHLRSRAAHRVDRERVSISGGDERGASVHDGARGVDAGDAVLAHYQPVQRNRPVLVGDHLSPGGHVSALRVPNSNAWPRSNVNTLVLMLMLPHSTHNPQ